MARRHEKEVQATAQFARAEVFFLAIVLFVSLLLRVAYHVEMRTDVLATQLQLDEAFHHRWAGAIASGDWVGREVFFRAPLYAYLLGITYGVFGALPEVPRLAQHLLGTVLVLLVYLLARALFGIRAAVAATLLAATYAVMIYFEGRLLFDFPLTVFVVLWFVLAIVYFEKFSWRRAAVLGLLFGCICIMRPTFLALAPVPFGLLVWTRLKDHRRRIGLALTVIAAALAPVLVVTIRNAVVGDDAVLIASQGGINFYIGNNAQADGMSSWFPEAGDVWGDHTQVEYLAEHAVGRQLLPSEVSAYWYAKGWEFVRSSPLAFLRLFVKKVYLFWSNIEIANNLSFYWFERTSLWLKALPVGFWLVGPLGIAGAFVAWKNRASRPLAIYLLLYCLLTALFFVSDRFRLPVLPVLCIFAGAAVDCFARHVMSRNWTSVAAGVALVAVAALIVNSNFAGVRRDTSFGDEGIRGHAALQTGDLAGAERSFARASFADPANSTLRISHGIALWGLGRLDEAVAAFRSGLAGNPFSASINLAHLYFNRGEMDSARMYAALAVRTRPYVPGGYIIAAKIALVSGDHRRAEEYLREGSAASKESFMYGDYLLAGIFLQTGRPAVADSLYRQVLVQVALQQQQPEYSLGTDKERFGENVPTLHGKALQGIGRIHALYGRLDSSETYLRSAAMILPKKGDVWADWGVVLLRLNRLSDADTVMRRAVALSPANPDVWFNYATLLARKGEFSLAYRAVSQALSLKPDFEEARQLRQAVAQAAMK